MYDHNKIQKIKNILPGEIFEEFQEGLFYKDLSTIQLIHFLANCHHECQWMYFQENFNYKASRLLAVFPSKFSSQSDAQNLIDQGETAIANYLYNGRLGNIHNTHDGYNFSGKGCLQLTGKYNYTMFNETVEDDILKNPQLVATKYKLQSAFWFFDHFKIFDIANSLDNDTIGAVRRKISGSLQGFDNVKSLIEIYKNILLF